VKDDSSKWEVFFEIVVSVAIFSFGCSAGSEHKEKTAIKAGVAYYTNNAAGESICVWRECK
jgi:hypothetical protein